MAIERIFKDEATEEKGERARMDVFSARLTLKSQLTIVYHMKLRLTANQEKIFREHCFGHWLDVKSPENDPGFVHHILQFRQIERPGLKHPREEVTELWFRVTDDHYIRFGRREFCLVTGLRFGPNDKMVDHIPENVRGQMPAFKTRVFPELGVKPVRIAELTKVFNDKGLFSGPRKLSDEDCVRVCMLILIYKGFLGKQPTHVVDDDYMRLLEDFGVCDRFPWGNIIWARTYNQLNKGLATRLTQDGMQYTLSGFCWACKAWIWEAFHHQVAMVATRPQRHQIPRGIYWERKKKVIEFKEFEQHLRVTKDTTQELLPKRTLIPNRYEKKCQWWIDSCSYFEEDRPLKKARNGPKIDDEPSQLTPPHDEPSPHHDDHATYDSLGTGRRDGSQHYDSLRAKVQKMKETIAEVPAMKETIEGLQKRVDEQQQTIDWLMKMVETRPADDDAGDVDEGYDSDTLFFSASKYSVAHGLRRSMRDCRRAPARLSPYLTPTHLKRLLKKPTKASFVGAVAIADLVKTTLGPKGMDKILQSTGRGHSVTVTNDGATILKSLHIDNPAAKVLIDISRVQDDEVGDGTTSVVVLAGELLREAEKLVATKIHPMTIISGYRMAADCARNALLDRVKDNKEDAEKFRLDLMKIAMTTLSSKILSQDKEHFATLAVDAVMRLKGSTNLESIQIIKKDGGSLKDSFLDEGFILDKKIGLGQPKRIENANILVANTAMDTDKVKIYGARVRVDSMAKVAQIEGAEKEKMREKVQKIIGHGINCFVNRQLIYNFPEELFADAGILAIEHADFDGIERLALVTGGEIASTFDNPESVKLGHCKLIEEIMIGEDKLIHFSGVEMGQACTIVLRGASFHVLDEAERSLHDALCVLSQTVNDSRVILGGGWPEMVMAKAVDELARKTPGKKSHAIDAFSRALLAIPTTIADNAGLDSAELIAQLRAEHHKEDSNAGIDVITGSVGDMSELGISEAFKVKQGVLLSATEAAEMILRVDEIITCAPRRREDRM